MILIINPRKWKNNNPSAEPDAKYVLIEHTGEIANYKAEKPGVGYICRVHGSKYQNTYSNKTYIYIYCI